MPKTKNNIQLPEYAKELFKPYRYKVLHGGRGGAKTTTIATILAIMAASKPLRVMCCREFQNSISESVKPAIEKSIQTLDLERFFSITDTEIKAPNGSAFHFKGIARNVMSIKGWEDYDICWIEEANVVSGKSWELLRPTIRKPGSEIWISFNRHSRKDPIDSTFIGDSRPDNSFVKEVNYYDNPFFPDELEQERLLCLEKQPEDVYNHIWLGSPDDRVHGGIFTKWVEKAKSDKRVCQVPHVAGYPVYTAWDLGYHDATCIWFFQLINGEIRFIDYYSDNFQETEHYIEVLKDKPYEYGELYLPHDAKQKRMNAKLSIAQQIKKAGFKVKVLPTGKGKGVKDGINVARSVLTKCWIDKEKCKDGIESLIHYRYEYDDRLQVFRKTPLHDKYSDPADAFRYASVAIEMPQNEGDVDDSTDDPAPNDVSWMAR